MMKHSIALMVTAMASLLTGCSLYFGEGNDHEDGDGSWTYCGSDGYYECQDENCSWVSASCPSGTAPGGFECKVNEDCAAGCYCGDGVCEEAGFCTQDSDCGTGYVCNEERASCEPGTPTPTCSADSECPNGQVCDPTTQSCTATCSCTTDQEAVAQGFDFCNEWRATCMSGSDPAGTCAGEATCNMLPPTCQPGDVPLIGADGCWTGECQAENQCAEPASCSHIRDAATCGTRADCYKVMNGINCHKISDPQQACNDGDTDCTCASYVFASCATK